AAGKTARNEERLARRGDPERLERVRYGRDRALPRIGERARHGQRRRLDDDRRAARAPGERLERLAVERETESLPRRGLGVGAAARRRRAQDERAVREGRHDDPAAGEEGYARHARIQPARFTDKYGLPGRRAARKMRRWWMRNARAGRPVSFRPCSRQASPSRSPSAWSPTPPATTPTYAAVSPAVAAGAHTFVQFACVQCHGPQGRGGVDPAVPALSKIKTSLTVGQLTHIIDHGLGES